MCLAFTLRLPGQYYSFYSGGKDWTNPTNYDLVLNSDRMGRQNCVRLSEDLVKIRFGSNR